MPETTRPQRVTAYQARIERTLTDIFVDVPQTTQAGQEWRLVSVAHTNGYASCDLCGHTPIKRLFFIESSSTSVVKMIGSECARNYVRVDLVEAYERTLNRHQNLNRMNARRDQQTAARRTRLEEVRQNRAAQAIAWTQAHPAEVAWLTANAAGSVFLSSLLDSYQAYNQLTERQLACVRDNMARASRAPAETRTNAADLAATPDQVPHIYNGTYTMDNGSSHLTFQVYTATRGPLQGKRIVKRQLQYGEFQGFAFVNADGTLGVWRRFAEQANELYMVWARELLACLNSREGGQAVGVDSLQHLGAGLTPFSIQRTRSCRRCNRQLTVPTSIESGIGPECSRRNTAEDRTRVADAHSDAAEAFEWAMNRFGGATEPAERVGATRTTRNHSRNTEARTAVRAVQQLEFSELGTGMLQ